MSLQQKVLIVEDASPTREWLQRVLASEACALTFVEDGDQALARLAEERFDVVILDLVVPGANGLEILSRVRSVGHAVEVIIFTAHPSLFSAVEALRLGAFNYLLKPTSAKDLRSTLRRALQKRLMAMRLEAVQSLSQRLSLSTHVEEVAQDVLEVISGVLDFGICGLWLVDEDRGRLTLLRSSLLEPGTAPSLSLDGERGITVAAVQRGELVYVPDVREDPRYVPLGGHAHNSEVAVPLMVKGRVTGVLNVESPQVDALTPDDLLLLRSLAQQAALALENARLHERSRAEIEERRRAEAALKEARDSLEMEVARRTADLVEANERLGESEARYRTLFDNITDAIFIHDKEGNFLEVNRVACERLGYSREELLRMTPRDIDAPEYARRVDERLDFVFETGGGILETAHVTRDGVVIPTELSSRVVEYEGQRVELSVARDITRRKEVEAELRRYREHLEESVERRTAELQETVIQLEEEVADRRRAELALKESEEKYRALVDDSLQGILIFQEGRIAFANPAMARMSGYEVAELLSLSPEEVRALVHPEDASELWERIERRLAGEEVSTFTNFRIARKDGATRWLEVLGNLTEYGGRTAIQALAIDVTERRRYADRLRDLAFRLEEVQEMERRRLSRELHDQVGQALTALGINLNILRGRCRGQDESVHACLEDSIQMVERTTELVRDVMADLRPPVLDDYGLMAALRWYGQRFESRTGVRTTVEGPEGDVRLSPRVENALFRIVQEALTNVAKHARATHAGVRMVVDEEQVTLTVVDDGVGLDFQPGTRLWPQMSWGLTIMEERAEAAGGRCLISSRSEGGVSVHVEVPR
jgi:two-component system sensor histidine kinase UhpB